MQRFQKFIYGFNNLINTYMASTYVYRKGLQKLDTLITLTVYKLQLQLFSQLIMVNGGLNANGLGDNSENSRVCKQMLILSFENYLTNLDLRNDCLQSTSKSFQFLSNKHNFNSYVKGVSKKGYR